MEIEIHNERELAEWETRIGALFQRLELDYVLGGIRQGLTKLNGFAAAGIALFAIRYSLPPIARPHELRTMPWGELAPLTNLVMQYLITDPATFDPPADDQYHGSTLIPIILRTAANQFPFDVSFWGQYARALKLFHYIPNEMRRTRERQTFDIGAAFEKINGVTLLDFIDVGYGSFAVATNNSAFTGGWFQKARDQGMKFDDEVVMRVLDQLAGDQWQLRHLSESYRQPDRRYGMHDFNPLFVYPLVRPWPKRPWTTLDEDRMIAPIPGLILTRLSTGIYDQLSFHYRNDFMSPFGLVFQNYVGEILKNSGGTLLTERQIKRKYKGRKIPDYVYIEGQSATLIECKAIGLQRKAMATADAKAIDYSVERIVEGLLQLHEFKHACSQRASGLEELWDCSEFRLMIVIFEPFYILNSDPFKEILITMLSDKLPTPDIRLSPWYVFAVDQLEKMQPHLNAGIRLSTVFDDLVGHRTFNDVLKEAADKTGRTYKDSFLYEMEVDIWNRLNIRFPQVPGSD